MRSDQRCKFEGRRAISKVGSGFASDRANLATWLPHKIATEVVVDMDADDVVE